jgi:hypothetical protein
MAMTPRSCSLAKSRLQLVVKRLRSCRHSASSTDSTDSHRLAVALRFRPMNDSKTSEDRDSDADHNADEQQQRAHASGSMRSSAFLRSSRWGVIVPQVAPESARRALAAAASARRRAAQSPTSAMEPAGQDLGAPLAPEINGSLARDRFDSDCVLGTQFESSQPHHALSKRLDA